MPKFSDLLPGILSGFGETITKNLQAEREHELRVQETREAERSKRQAAAEFPTPEQALLAQFLGGPGRSRGQQPAQGVQAGGVGAAPTGGGEQTGLSGIGMQGFDITSLRLGPFTLEKPKLTGTQKTTLSEIKALKNGIVELKSLAANVDKGPVQGRFTSFVAKVTGGGGLGAVGVPPQEAADADIYQRIKPGFARGIYRAVTGDKRISDLDAAQAALPFIPDLSQATGAFNQQFRIVERALLNREKFIEAFAKRGAEAPTLTSPEFVALMRTAEQEIKGTAGATPDADAAFLRKLQQQFPESSIRQVR